MTEPAPIVPDADVRALLDMIATSMDFGSGFLDTPEVALLRRVAHMVGIDQNAVTPDNMPHRPEPRYTGPERHRFAGPEPHCAKCFKPWRHPLHTAGWPEIPERTLWNDRTEEWEVVPPPPPAPKPAPPKPSKFTLNLNTSAGR